MSGNPETYDVEGWPSEKALFFTEYKYTAQYIANALAERGSEPSACETSTVRLMMCDRRGLSSGDLEPPHRVHQRSR
jgi:hypothetical protein